MLQTVSYLRMVALRKDTFHALIMEEIGDPFLDLSGDTIYKLNRFFKEMKLILGRE